MASGNNLPDWKDYINQLMPIGERVIKQTPHPDDPQARQETWKWGIAAIANAFVGHIYADVDYPELVSTFNMAINLMAPNPDYMYTWAPIDSAGVYRVRGFRNNCRFAEFSLLDGYYTEGNNKGTVSLIDLDSLTLGADTSFDLTISRERPKDHKGDWAPLPPNATNILLRSAAYDWVNERDPLVSIERLDVPAMRPRWSAEKLAGRLGDLASWVETGLVRGFERFPDLLSRNLRNGIAVHDYVSLGGTLEQIYLEGIFDLADDEALLIETTIPKKVRYWGFLTTDDQFATIDWMNRQSSLNAHQARVDADGKFRGVISLKDPGVPNWLDTGGYRYGIYQGRWNKADSTPVPSAKVVKLADLRKHLPADTPVVTPEQRETIIRDRRMGAQFRRKW